MLPVEQPRRKRDVVQPNRRMNALKHQHTHPVSQAHPALFKDAFGSAKIGNYCNSLHNVIQKYL